MSSAVQESDVCSILPLADPGTILNNETGDNAASSSESENSDNQPDVAVASRPTFFNKMLMLCKEIAVMFLLAATYAALTNDTPVKVTKSPAAYPFFPKNSLVTDWYRGQITEAIEEARSSDIAFVMFYAPWDAESQLARKQLELTAKFVQDRITFAAVNCWQPGSECRRQYNKVYKWPILIAYPTHGRGVQYNGPINVVHMIKFLNNICTPVIRLFDIDDLLGRHDTVILANVDVLPGSYKYAVFYSTALRFLERDPFRDIIFTVNPQKAGLNSTIHMVVWNSTIAFEDEEWNVENLYSWILKKLHQVVVWANPTGTKSLLLSNYVQPGPALIVFTPKNPLHTESDYFNMLREIAYDYNSCIKNTYSHRQKLIAMERTKSFTKHKHLRHLCGSTRHSFATQPSKLWTNISVDSICNYSSNSDVWTASIQNEYLRRSPTDRRYSECWEYLLAEQYALAMFEQGTDNNMSHITGLACKTNRTLTFLVMDSLRHYHFAEKLGIDLSNRESKSAAVIIDDKMETHYVLDAELNKSSLRDFIYNFTEAVLHRSLYSTVHVKSKKTHSYSPVNVNHLKDFSLLELSSDNFLGTIQQPNVVVIVFYYSKQCSFCNGISYMYLEVAKMLQSVEEILFSRIDGDINLLPWEYTMDHYPSILFFPAIRKEESRVFPKNMLITVPNLLGFLLSNADPVLRLKIMWEICSQSKFKEDKTECVTSVRVETLTVINQTLREWRNSTRKQHVLHRLQLLRHLHLLFAHSPTETLSIKKVFNRMKM